MTRAKAIDRIQKILALARAAGTEAEAAAATAAAQKLLADYRLSPDDLEAEAVIEMVIHIESGWPAKLLTVIAGGCGCQVIAFDAARHLGALVGRRLDAMTALRLFYRIRPVLAARVDEEWAVHVRALTDPVYGGDGRHPSLHEPQAEEEWRAGFIAGALTTIRQTLNGKGPRTVHMAPLSDDALVLVTTSRELAYMAAGRYIARHYRLQKAVPAEEAFGLGSFKWGRKVTL